ncbi:MAG TPA: hypothetical protein VG778_11995 [Blastocatellia bacterium]|nr:hypothetical protein [Blastocatellia bacterium]
MRLTRIQIVLTIAIVLTVSAVGALAAAMTQDQKFAGSWAGSYTVDGGPSSDLTYVFSKDEKGQWRGSLTFTNDNGVNKAEFKSLQIANGKLKGKVSTPDGSAEVDIQGTLKGDAIEGTYAVSPSSTTDVVEKGTWKVTRKTP